MIVGSPPRDQLTDCEKRVYQQVLSRAAGRGDVPARALSDGFAGLASENLKSAEDRFMEAFAAEVKDDSRRRGLSRQRLSEGVGCLLWPAAAVPAVSLGLALHARLGSLGLIVIVVLWALVPATIAGVVLSSGTLKLELLLVLAVDVTLALIAFTRYQSKPASAEFDGLVLEAWIETISDENSSSEVPYLAIDDGVRDRAWVFEVSSQQYAVGIPGTFVHALVDPRRNALLEIRPLLPQAPD